MKKIWLVAFGGCLAIGTTPALAQNTKVKTEAVFLRAQQLVNDGEAAVGRALVDSVLRVAASGTPRYGEALYWRAILAATTDAAESDYKQILVDYPESPRVDDVLLRLAQLESAHGDRDGAQRHLQRLVTEFPDGPFRARGSYWLGRVLMDKNETAKACAANADAATRVGASEVELKNQIEYMTRRCASAIRAAVSDSLARADSVRNAARNDSIAAKAKADSIEAKAKADSAAIRDSIRAARKGKGKTKATDSAAKLGAKKDSVKKTETGAELQTGKDIVAAGKKARQKAKDDSIATARAMDSIAKISATKNMPEETARTAGRIGFSVQVGAFKERMMADAAVKKYRAQGYKARVDGDAAPYRVRIGWLETHADAVKLLKVLKTNKIDGFIVQSEAR